MSIVSIRHALESAVTDQTILYNPLPVTQCLLVLSIPYYTFAVPQEIAWKKRIPGAVTATIIRLPFPGSAHRPGGSEPASVSGCYDTPSMDAAKSRCHSRS